MKAMIYVIRFEENLDLDDLEWHLKKIESPIRLEIGDVIGLGLASFDEDLDKGSTVELMGYLLERSIYSVEYPAYFKISDIMYSHDYYDGEIRFNGVITLKGK